MSSRSTNFQYVSRLIGQPVHDTEGRPVGPIRELIIEPLEGRIAYVMLLLKDSHGRVFGQATVPWSTVSQCAEGDWKIAVRLATLCRVAEPVSLHFTK